MARPHIVIVTPALAAANNGNWHTASRWARFLSPDYRVTVCDAWTGGDERAMLALHARRSFASIDAWRRAHPQRALVVVLTGTDLYRDIASDVTAQRSLTLADRLVVLNDLGAQALPVAVRAKAHVCLQSATPRHGLAKTTRHLRALMVGHLRDEKDPRTYLAAARRLASRHDILFDHIGAPLDPALGTEARALQHELPTYRWLGALPHAATRAHIQRAHLLVHPSRMEGGAQVVIEAVQSGTPVVASRIAGNVGLLGADHGGLFEPGDAAGLARLLQAARDDPAMLVALQAQGAARAARFMPERERSTLRELLAELLGDPP